MIQNRLAANLATQERKAKARLRELEQIARRQKAADKELARLLGGKATPSQLENYLVEGLIDPGTVEFELTERNWGQTEIAALMAEAQLKIDRKRVKSNGKPK